MFLSVTAVVVVVVVVAFAVVVVVALRHFVWHRRHSRRVVVLCPCSMGFS